MKKRNIRAIAAVGLALALGACSSEKIADNTTDAVVFTGKTVAKGAVGAGKLAVRGGKAAYNSVQDARANASDFPPGTRVCAVPGGYAPAPQRGDGTYFCPPQG